MMKLITCFLTAYLYAANAAAFLIICNYDHEWDEYRWNTDFLILIIFFATAFGLAKLEVLPPLALLAGRFNRRNAKPILRPTAWPLFSVLTPLR